MWSVGHIYKKALKDLPIIKPNYLIIYSGINEYSNYQNLKLNHKIDVNKSIANKSNVNDKVNKENTLKSQSESKLRSDKKSKTCYKSTKIRGKIERENSQT